jgi:hypothetical protein
MKLGPLSTLSTFFSYGCAVTSAGRITSTHLTTILPFFGISQCERAWRIEMPGALCQKQIRQWLSSRQEARTILRPDAARSAQAGAKPNFSANCVWLNLSLRRIARTSTTGTLTIVTRTGTSSPRPHARAWSRPRMMCSPGVRFARPAVLLRLLLVFFTSASFAACG